MNSTRVTRYILRTWYKALRDPEGYWFKRNLKWLYGGLKNVSDEDRYWPITTYQTMADR